MIRIRVAGALACLLGLALPADAGTLSGEVWLEMEYLGESYFSEFRYSGDDLGLPSDVPLVLVDTTRFAEDSWLPGPRLAFAWRTKPEARTELELSSRTAFNRERFYQELRFFGSRPGGNGVWRMTATGNLREESRSLVGHGDWGTQLDLSREQNLGSLRGTLRGIWQHSRTRGDSLTYLFDYDIARLRASLAGGGGWLPVWEGYLEAALKEVPGDREGSYHEARAGATWRSGGARYRTLDLRTRWRDYRDSDGPGRDYVAADLEFHGEAARWQTHSIPVDAAVAFVDYAGSDALYFDQLETRLYLPWRWEPLPWNWTLGPQVALLWDLDGTDRDYRQATLKTVLSRLVGSGGYAEITVEGGYRDYRNDNAEFIEITSLSSTFLRSDYWLFDLLAVVNVPVGDGFSVDLLGSSSWEFHAAESERIQITLVNLAMSRRF